MTLQELKEFLDGSYQMDISKKIRKRKYVYAKKVFIQLAKNYGYNWVNIEDVIGQPHDLLIYHYNTFSSIFPVDLDAYNSAIKNFQLPIEEIPSMSWYINGRLVQEIVNKLGSLNQKDLKYFDLNVLDKFLMSVKQEKEYEEIVNKK